MPNRDNWISVKDRLPEENYALVIVVGENALGFQKVWLSHYEKHEAEMFADGLDGYKVTHWMPLPEPPEEVSEYAE